MHDNDAQSDFVHNLQKRLLDDLIAAVEAEQLSMPQMREAAKFILDGTEHIEESAVEGFLKELNDRWPVFKNTQTIAGGKAAEDKEQEVIDKLSSYIKSMDTDNVN